VAASASSRPSGGASPWPFIGGGIAAAVFAIAGFFIVRSRRA
jgi:hypothetical protein